MEDKLFRDEKDFLTEIFVEISDGADSEGPFAKALKEQPKRFLMGIPEWKERKLDGSSSPLSLLIIPGSCFF